MNHRLGCPQQESPLCDVHHTVKAQICVDCAVHHSPNEAAVTMSLSARLTASSQVAFS